MSVGVVQEEAETLAAVAQLAAQPFEDVVGHGVEVERPLRLLGLATLAGGRNRGVRAQSRDRRRAHV